MISNFSLVTFVLKCRNLFSNSKPNFHLFLGAIILALTQTSYSQSVSISSSVSGIVELGGGNVDLVVSLDSGAVNTTGSDITGTIIYVGSATDGVDYVSIPGFVIPNGANSVTISPFVFDDPDCESNESIIAAISSLNVGTINPNSNSVSIDIIDDDCSQVLISIGSPVDGTEGVSDISYIFSLKGE